jgi:hypothetical protein
LRARFTELPPSISLSRGTFSFLSNRKDWLRRRQRIGLVVPREAFGTLGDRTPTAEELVLAREQGGEAEAVLGRAEERLSARQRRYFEAVVEDARKHGYLSEVRVAEKLGLNKSQVSRALRTIIKALRKAGAMDLLEGLKLGAPRAKRRLWRDESRENRRNAVR